MKNEKPISAPLRWWGVASAAFQVEGTPGDSDWRAWTREPGRIRDGTNADRATDFWNRYEEDLDLARAAGMNAFRLSLAWERLEPSPGVFDEAAIARYRVILRACRDRGLEPHVTLHHFVTPGWLARLGGPLSETFPERFAAFAARIVPEFSREGLVTEWTTFNEPNVCVAGGYLAGEFPPGGENDFASATIAAYHIALGHREAVTRVRAALDRDFAAPEASRIRLGIVMHLRDFQAASPRNPFDRFAARLTDWVFNRQILNGALTGRIFSWFPGTTVRRSPPPPGSYRGLDFLGVNYYGRMMVRASIKPPFVELYEGTDGPRSDLDWEIYPAGLETVLVDCQARYGLPTVVSENGVADAHDRHRPEFLRTHLASLDRARGRGANVEGYLHWSLTDNFEWAHGEVPRFGLVAIDYATGTRTPRPSYFVYRDLIAASRSFRGKEGAI